MKRLLLGLVLSAALGGGAQAQPADMRMSFGFFYSSLSPHGEWVRVDAGYGWRPYNVVHGWRPYFNGRWVWTSYGWYWVSYEQYGWIVYHYGRWYYDDFYGWIWIPDYEWGPAWVEWRYNYDYIGWAPLPPYATFSVSVGIRFSRVWVAPAHYWTFVGCRNFTSVRIVDYAVPVERTRRIFGSTRGSVQYDYDNGRVVNRGVETSFIERRTGNRIDRVDVTETHERGSERIVREGDRERVEVYRPRREEIERAPEMRREERRSDRPAAIERSEPDRGTRMQHENRRVDSPREFRRPSENRMQREEKGSFRMQEKRSRPEPRMEERRSGGEKRKDGYG